METIVEERRGVQRRAVDGIGEDNNRKKIGAEKGYMKRGEKRI